MGVVVPGEKKNLNLCIIQLIGGLRLYNEYISTTYVVLDGGH
jgi:hypothetical protein